MKLVMQYILENPIFIALFSLIFLAKLFVTVRKTFFFSGDISKFKGQDSQLVLHCLISFYCSISKKCILHLLRLCDVFGIERIFFSD